MDELPDYQPSALVPGDTAMSNLEALEQLSLMVYTKKYGNSADQRFLYESLATTIQRHLERIDKQTEHQEAE